MSQVRLIKDDLQRRVASTIANFRLWWVGIMMHDDGYPYYKISSTMCSVESPWNRYPYTLVEQATFQRCA